MNHFYVTTNMCLVRAKHEGKENVMTTKHNVSDSVIRRLPRYYRFLGELLSSGIERISSKELSNRMGLTASQIRQDLNCFGGFGQQGYGYNITELHGEIETILGINNKIRVVLIGAGNLGLAIASYMNFKQRGFQLVGIFEKDPAKIGKKIRDVEIYHIDTLKEICDSLTPTAAVLCVPKDVAKNVVEDLIPLGINGFLNFSHYDIALEHNDVYVENVHISDSFMTLGFKLKQGDKNEDQ